VSGPTDNERNSNSFLFRLEFQLPGEDSCRDDWVIYSHFFGGDDLPLRRFLHQNAQQFGIQSNTVHSGSQLVLTVFSCRAGKPTTS